METNGLTDRRTYTTFPASNIFSDALTGAHHCQKTEKSGPTHEPRYRASAKISFIIAVQPLYGCQRNARKNITVTVSVRVSVTVRVSLV